MSASYSYLQTHPTFGPIYANIKTTMEEFLDGHDFQLSADDVNFEVQFYLDVSI